MVVDLSHVGERTSLDAIEVSSRPAIFSHSNAGAVTPHARNISDETIRAVAARGGLVCATPYGPCSSADPARGLRATLDDFLRHIDHIAGLVGVDHVGIGTDQFEGKGEAEWNATTKRRYPESVEASSFDNVRTAGFESVSPWPLITEKLLERGYSADDVRKIVGGNFLRVFREVAG